MYKNLKIKKRISISLTKFNPSLKNDKWGKTYRNGLHKNTDEINSISFYTLTIYVFKITLVIEHKNKMGHCPCLKSNL
jgi:hypothetical protein